MHVTRRAAGAKSSGTWLSVSAVAEQLGLQQAHVHRLAASGSLPSSKSPGGLLRFRRDDIELLRTLTPDDPHEGPSLDQLVQVALAGDVDTITSILVDGARRDGAVAPVLERVVVPLMHETGDRWMRGALSVAQEHVITNVVTEALVLVRRELHTDMHLGLAAALSCGGDEHELGARMAQVCLEVSGFRCIHLGRGLGSDELIAWCAKSSPDVLTCSIPITTDPRRVALDVIAVAASTAAHTRILLGGAGASKLTGVHERVDVLHSLRELEAAVRCIALP